MLGFVVVGAAVLAYFAAHGALEDLRLATLDYNLRYSNETYDGIPGLVRYLVTFPIVRARVEPLWFVGGLGTALLLLRARASASSLVVFGWIVAAIVSIAINGGRSLPNYFVQANPALALAASAGLASAVGASRWVRYAVVVLLLGALWRVGSDTPLWGLRLASIPGLVENVRYDLDYIRGSVDRDTYLVAVSRAETRRAGKRAARALRSGDNNSRRIHFRVWLLRRQCLLAQRTGKLVPILLEPASDD